MITFFDTETTGLADFKLPYNHNSQPRLVQLALIRTTNDGKEIDHCKLLVRPDGFEIGAKATEAHGITTDFANAHGMPCIAALRLFYAMAGTCDFLVAYNARYDEIVINNEFSRMAGISPATEPNKPGRTITVEGIRPIRCAMEPMTAICKLPGRFSGQFKWPKLQEAYKHCFGKEFDGAHDALADVRATAAVYFWMKNNVASAPSGQ